MSLTFTLETKTTDPGPVIHRKRVPVPGKRGTCSYRDEFAQIALGAAVLGATHANLAELFDVHVDTIDDWKHAHPAFREAVEEGTNHADQKVARSYYSRAIGYNVTTERTEVRQVTGVDGKVTVSSTTVRTEAHIPPDATACARWLALRRGWRDTGERQITAEMLIEFAEMARAEAARRGIDFRAAIDVTPMPPTLKN